MTTQPLAADSPKVFQALARFLGPEELALVELDYTQAQALGGNSERGLMREEGVSFNPRLARIMSIIIRDLAVRDPLVIRASLYCAVLDSGFGVEQPQMARSAELDVPAELQSLVGDAAFSSPRAEASLTIRAVIALDTVRHLHQGSSSTEEREATLLYAQSLVRRLAERDPSTQLAIKLNHAIELQRRRGSVLSAE
jgi:hypothetical protein